MDRCGRHQGDGDGVAEVPGFLVLSEGFKALWRVQELQRDKMGATQRLAIAQIECVLLLSVAQIECVLLSSVAHIECVFLSYLAQFECVLLFYIAQIECVFLLLGYELSHQGDGDGMAEVPGFLVLSEGFKALWRVGEPREERCRSQLLHKSVNLSSTIFDMKNKLTDLCGN